MAKCCKKTGCRYIDGYVEAIESGVVPAGKELRQAMGYFRRRLAEPDVFIDAAKAEKAAGMIERYFKITLMDWELFILALVHCYHQSDDTVVFQEFLIVMGRGNGKNGFVSALAWYLTTKCHGVDGYNIDIVANSEAQAKTSFEDIYEMLERTWKETKHSFYKSKALIRHTGTKSYIRYNTSNADTKDGTRSACLIFDEIHAYENFDTINVFTSSFGKRRHSRIFYITTNGYVREGVLDEKLAEARGVLNGAVQELPLAPLIYKLDDDAEADTPGLWIKANPSLPYFPLLRQEIEKRYAEIGFQAHVKNEFYTKRMNLPRSDREVQITDWANIKATFERDGQPAELPEMAGRSCAAGIDYAALYDFASVNLHFLLEDGVRCDLSHSWLCLRSPDLERIRAPWREWAGAGHITPVDEKEIPPELLAEWLEKAAQVYDIKGLALDNFKYALMKNALRAAGFDTDNRKNLKCVRPSDIMRVIPIISSAMNNQLFLWGDAPVLRWAAWNTKLLRRGKAEGTDTGNFYYAKIEARSRKNDPWMALVHAMTLENEIEQDSGGWDGLPLIIA